MKITFTIIVAIFIVFSARMTKEYIYRINQNQRAEDAVTQIEKIKSERCWLLTSMIASRVDDRFVSKDMLKMIYQNCNSINLED